MGALEDAQEAQAVAAAAGHTAGPVEIGQLVSVGTGEAVVSVRGSAPIALPAVLPGLYAGYTTVWVLCAPDGRGVLVLGPAGAQEHPPLVPSSPAGTVGAKATITPTWSGTYRVSRAAWDRWNVDRYGGRSDLYQGADFGSGALKGLACYGDQVADLGAVSIDSAVLVVQRNGSGGSAAVTVQGSPHGARPAGAPASSGTTASSASLTRTGKGTIALPADVREGLRTGAVKGLALVGGTYAGVFGTSRPDGMALVLSYSRPA